MSRPSIPKAERSIFYTRVDALRPNDPSLGIDPAADNNVMKVTRDCLFMRTASGRMYGGRRSMSWWAVVVVIFIFVLNTVLEYVSYTSDREHNGCVKGILTYYLENWEYTVGITAVALLGFSWTFIPWRTQFPIIFNRRTHKVTCVIRGKSVSQSWEHLEAYIKDVTTFAAGGAPANEGVLTLVFPHYDPDWPNANGRQRIGITATQDADEAF